MTTEQSATVYHGVDNYSTSDKTWCGQDVVRKICKSVYGEEVLCRSTVYGDALITATAFGSALSPPGGLLPGETICPSCIACFTRKWEARTKSKDHHGNQGICK